MQSGSSRPGASADPDSPEPQGRIESWSPEATEQLDRSLLSGLVWIGGAKWLIQGLTWLSTLVVARLLQQEDYGIIAMAGTYFGLVQLVGEFGLGAAVVQQRDLSRSQVSRLAGLSMLFAAACAALSLALAGPVAAFFDAPELVLVIVVLSSTFLLTGLQVIPRSLLAQDHRFRTLAKIETAENLLMAATTVTFAFLGFRYWALVIGALAGRLLTTVLLLVVRPHPMAWPTPLKEIRPAVSFGWHMVTGNLAWYAFRNADLAVVGRVLGKAALGAYSIGFTLASIPVDRVVGLISRVSPAILATVQSEPRLLRRYLLGLTEGIAVATMPMAIGMALVARDFVITAIGAKWEPAIAPLIVLSLAAVARSLVSIPSQVLVATGRPRANARGTMLIALLLSPLFLLATRWGIVGVALVWLAAYPIVAGLALVRPALEAIECRAREFAGSFAPAVNGSLAMAAAVGLVSVLLPDDHPMVSRLVIKIGAGALAYLGVLFGLYRSRIRTVVGLLRTSSARPHP